LPKWVLELLRFMTTASTLSRYHHSIITKNIIEQVEPHICEILRLCGVLNAEGGELHKLNELETNKFVEDV